VSKGEWGGKPEPSPSCIVVAFGYSTPKSNAVAYLKTFS